MKMITSFLVVLFMMLFPVESIAEPTHASIQSPCQVIISRNHHCAVVLFPIHRETSGVVMNTAVTAGLRDNVRVFSVVYLVFQTYSREDNISMRIYGPSGIVTSHIPYRIPIPFWTTTYDGGRTWTPTRTSSKNLQ